MRAPSAGLSLALALFAGSAIAQPIATSLKLRSIWRATRSARVPAAWRSRIRHRFGHPEALERLMERLAKHLGATHVIANRLEIKDGFATGRLLRPVVAGPEKARLIREHAKSKNLDLGECYAYSDSYSDVPMLSVVGYPAAVNPDTKLERLARTYGWPVLSLDKKKLN